MGGGYSSMSSSQSSGGKANSTGSSMSVGGNSNSTATTKDVTKNVSVASRKVTDQACSLHQPTGSFFDTDNPKWNRE